MEKEPLADKYKVVVNKSGTTCRMLGKVYHRGDGPAIIFLDGEAWWFENGEHAAPRAWRGSEKI